MIEKTSARRVVVVDYDPQWPFMFEAEADRIRGVFGKEITAIYHIGSTAVPGLTAKPIIDMMPLVRDIEAYCDGKNEFIKNLEQKAIAWHRKKI